MIDLPMDGLLPDGAFNNHHLGTLDAVRGAVHLISKSSASHETARSEYGCQGLELDSAECLSRALNPQSGRHRDLRSKGQRRRSDAGTKPQTRFSPSDANLYRKKTEACGRVGAIELARRLAVAAGASVRLGRHPIKLPLPLRQFDGSIHAYPVNAHTHYMLI